MTLVIHSSPSELQVTDVLSLPVCSIDMCWDAIKLRQPFSWCLAVDLHTLWFVCSLPGSGRWNGSYHPGEFVEGLWEEDVAELFIKGSDGSYQEFNLSPAGAWWTMSHSSYRVRNSEGQAARLLHVGTEVGEEEWKVVAQFTWDGLHVPSLASSMFHISGICHDRPRRYLSSQVPAQVSPDFHHEGCFQSVVMVDLGA